MPEPHNTDGPSPPCPVCDGPMVRTTLGSSEAWRCGACYEFFDLDAKSQAWHVWMCPCCRGRLVPAPNGWLQCWDCQQLVNPADRWHLQPRPTRLTLRQRWRLFKHEWRRPGIQWLD